MISQTGGFSLSVLAGAPAVITTLSKIINPKAQVDATIAVIAYNEEGFIERMLATLITQDYFEYANNYEIILVDSGSTDKTVEIASKYVDRVIQAKKGKLSARNQSIKEAKYDIVVNLDADILLFRNTLSHLLKPFEDDNVVATTGILFEGVRTWSWIITRLFAPRIIGTISAVRKNAFVGFDESIDQLNRELMILEEEIRFMRRMKARGKVVQTLACVLHPPRRAMCVIGSDMFKKYCEMIYHSDRF